MRASLGRAVCRFTTTTRIILPKRYATTARYKAPVAGLSHYKKEEQQQQQPPPQRPEQTTPSEAKALWEALTGAKSLNFAVTSKAGGNIGSRVNTVAFEHRIKFPSALRSLKVRYDKPNRGNIQVFTNKSHVFNQHDMRWFDQPEHPNAGCVLDRYVSWSDGSQPLWWSAAAFGNAAPFVCTTAQRLLNRAIRLALEENGYDRFGRAIAVPGSQPQRPDLYGTLRILCSDPKRLCQLKFSTDILEMGQNIVAAALPHLATVQNGESACVAKSPTQDALAVKQNGFPPRDQSWDHRQERASNSRRWENLPAKRRAPASFPTRRSDNNHEVENKKAGFSIRRVSAPVSKMRYSD